MRASTLLSWVALWALGFVRASVRARTGGCRSGSSLTFGVVRNFPLKKEEDAHEALSLLFHRDGFPNVMAMDGTKAQVEGEFRRKLRDAGCHIK
jgi:hypothetical protein